jgi:hypothetical protein
MAITKSSNMVDVVLNFFEIADAAIKKPKNGDRC